MLTDNNILRYGFILAGLANIGGVLLFSQGLHNPTINELDPVVMSNFGLVMIMVWGLAYISVAHKPPRMLCLVFALEKAIYALVWLKWMLTNRLLMPTLFQENPLAAIFYSIYGPNDLLFMLFFLWVFFKIGKLRRTNYY